MFLSPLVDVFVVSWRLDLLLSARIRPCCWVSNGGKKHLWFRCRSSVYLCFRPPLTLWPSHKAFRNTVQDARRWCYTGSNGAVCFRPPYRPFPARRFAHGSTRAGTEMFSSPVPADLSAAGPDGFKLRPRAASWRPQTFTVPAASTTCSPGRSSVGNGAPTGRTGSSSGNNVGGVPRTCPTRLVSGRSVWSLPPHLRLSGARCGRLGAGRDGETIVTRQPRQRFGTCPASRVATTLSIWHAKISKGGVMAITERIAQVEQGSPYGTFRQLADRLGVSEERLRGSTGASSRAALRSKNPTGCTGSRACSTPPKSCWKTPKKSRTL